MAYPIDWRRARATGRVISHTIERGVVLFGWCVLAYIGALPGLLAALKLRESDAVLWRLAKQVHEANPATAMQARNVLLLALIASVAVTVLTLRKIVQWFRHTEKRN